MLSSPESLRQTLQQIGCNQRKLSHPLAHHIPGESMKMNSSHHSPENILRILSNETCDHASQDISCAARRHTRVARGVDPSLAVRPHYERAMAFEHDDHFMLARKFPRHVEAIVLNIGNRAAGQSSHLAGMARQIGRA